MSYSGGHAPCWINSGSINKSFPRGLHVLISDANLTFKDNRRIAGDSREDNSVKVSL